MLFSIHRHILTVIYIPVFLLISQNQLVGFYKNKVKIDVSFDKKVSFDAFNKKNKELVSHWNDQLDISRFIWPLSRDNFFLKRSCVVRSHIELPYSYSLHVKGFFRIWLGWQVKLSCTFSLLEKAQIFLDRNGNIFLVFILVNFTSHLRHESIHNAVMSKGHR